MNKKWFTVCTACAMATVEALAQRPCWYDANGDRKCDVEDMILYEQNPVDLDGDGVATSADRDALAAAARGLEMVEATLAHGRWAEPPIIVNMGRTDALLARWTGESETVSLHGERDSLGRVTRIVEVRITDAESEIAVSGMGSQEIRIEDERSGRFVVFKLSPTSGASSNVGAVIWDGTAPIATTVFSVPFAVPMFDPVASRDVSTLPPWSRYLDVTAFSNGGVNTSSPVRIVTTIRSASGLVLDKYSVHMNVGDGVHRVPIPGVCDVTSDSREVLRVLESLESKARNVCDVTSIVEILLSTAPEDIKRVLNRLRPVLSVALRRLNHVCTAIDVKDILESQFGLSVGQEVLKAVTLVGGFDPQWADFVSVELQVGLIGADGAVRSIQYVRFDNVDLCDDFGFARGVSVVLPQEPRVEILKVHREMLASYTNGPIYPNLRWFEFKYFNFPSITYDACGFVFIVSTTSGKPEIVNPQFNKPLIDGSSWIDQYFCQLPTSGSGKWINPCRHYSCIFMECLRPDIITVRDPSGHVLGVQLVE